ncbi:MAG: hypothetical protein K8E66_07830, partial [Phycisphaerales bacterium]|nr:hypothetical protein [Phycisphaerales bacterium]
MTKLARKLDEHRDSIPTWCREALSLERIERVGAHGCFWLLFFDEESRIVHAAGAMPGSEWPLADITGRCLADLPDSPRTDERRGVFQRIIANPDHPVLVIDMWRGLEVWWLCEVECDLHRHRGVLAIGFRPCVEQPTPEDTEVVRLRHVTDTGRLVQLSLGEIEVLRLLALGLTREEMSHEVHRTIKAVERRRTT